MPGAELAAAQLAAWRKLADQLELREDGRCLRCGRCGKGVMLLTDDQGYRYVYSHEEYRALIVLHLRNHHADLDPN